MSNIETIICLVLLFMVVPDVCRKLGRPALVFAAFVIFGILLGPFVNNSVRTMLNQAGEVGFLLLLFEVGLEIELPPIKQLAKPLRYAVVWALIQYPLIFGLGMITGLTMLESFVAAAALTACSVGMSHPAWKNYPGLEAGPKQLLLNIMVSLEVIAVIVLALETTALESGWRWTILLKLAGISITVFLIARFATHLTNAFQLILERTTHWRVHLLVLLVLLVCAAGERLGLSAAKTAFFLGLAMSRAIHAGQPLEEYIAPISRRFLIPVFFVALGLLIEWRFLFHWNTLLALGGAGLLLGLREVIQRRWFKLGGDQRLFLLLCPNLTIVALAAKTMSDHGLDPQLTAWLVFTGLFMTIPSLMLMPAGATGEATKPNRALPGTAASRNNLAAPAEGNAQADPT